jgi:hypothetical protein
MSYEMGTRILMWSLVLLVVLHWLRPPGWLIRRRRQQFTQQTGAYLDPHFVDAFDRETRRSLRWLAVLGVILGLVLEVFLDLGAERRGGSPLAYYSPLAAVWLTVLAATRLRTAGREFTVANQRSAVARARRVVVGDYVSWPLQLATWVLVAVDAVLGAVTALSWQRGGADGDLVLIGLGTLAITVGAAAGCQWFARALCERPTPAVDASHLYLQDAWRSRALSAAHLAVCISGLVAFLGLVYLPDVRWMDAAIGVAFYPLIGAIVVVASVQPKWFRRRLWRTLPPGVVLQPGQAIPSVGASA